ncbi:MAG TPA: manganese efflux pump [Candidatus Lokiarchaeia archaeon]|nr:manganese efflux pump [Candidatus Lokiarchaeia archaeon]
MISITDTFATGLVELANLLLMSFSLNIDTIALSVSVGMISKPIKARMAITLALAFSFPQTLLLIAGWLGGHVLSDFIAQFATWVAFAILIFIGGKMIFDALQERGKEDQERHKLKGMSTAAMIWLGFAMGFDAMAVGVSYGLIDTGILLVAIVLTIATIVYSLAGTYLGASMKKIPDTAIHVLAGCIIIGIGIQVLIEYFL